MKRPAAEQVQTLKLLTTDLRVLLRAMAFGMGEGQES
jgi:hypothetical protein